jgi:hypothetical protein
LKKIPREKFIIIMDILSECFLVNLAY